MMHWVERRKKDALMKSFKEALVQEEGLRDRIVVDYIANQTSEMKSFKWQSSFVTLRDIVLRLINVVLDWKWNSAKEN